jgi:hypothetical protein
LSVIIPNTLFKHQKGKDNLCHSINGKHYMFETFCVSNQCLLQQNKRAMITNNVKIRVYNSRLKTKPNKLCNEFNLQKNGLNTLNKVQSQRITMQYVIKAHTSQLWIMKPNWLRSWRIDTSFFCFTIINIKDMNFSSYLKYFIFPCMSIDESIHMTSPSCETHQLVCLT